MNYLSGNLWPVHLKPKRDELLTSWLTRLAIAHGMGFPQFCQYAFKYDKFSWTDKEWERDCDRFGSDELVEFLSRKTATPVDRIRATMIGFYEGKLFEKHSDYPNLTWVTLLKVNKRESDFKDTKGQQYCPKCLEEDEDPYFRREWRLAIVVFCVKHKIRLIDQCPHCQAAISYRKSIISDRVGTKSFSLIYCYNCQGDIREIKSEVHFNNTTNKEIEFQQYLLEGLAEEWINIPKIGYIYSHLYFAGLKALAGVLTYGKHSSKIREAIAKKYKVDNFQIYSTPDMKKTIERLGVLERRSLLNMLRILLTDWPDEFVKFFEQQKIGRAILYRYEINIPFWYSSVVDNYLSKHRYKISKQELESAYKYRQKLIEESHYISPRDFSEPLQAVTKFMRRAERSEYYVPEQWPNLQFKFNWGKNNYKIQGKKNYEIQDMRRMDDKMWVEVKEALNRVYTLIEVQNTENDRELMNGLFYCLLCSCPWRKIPVEGLLYHSIYKRYKKFKEKGFLPELLSIGSKLYTD